MAEQLQLPDTKTTFTKHREKAHNSRYRWPVMSLETGLSCGAFVHPLSTLAWPLNGTPRRRLVCLDKLLNLDPHQVTRPAIPMPKDGYKFAGECPEVYCAQVSVRRGGGFLWLFER